MDTNKKIAQKKKQIKKLQEEIVQIELLPVGRPRQHDVIAYLQEHPELADKNWSIIAKTIGCTEDAVRNQIVRAILDGTIYLTSVVRFPISNAVKGNKQYLSVTNEYVEAYADRLQKKVKNDKKKRKDKIREYNKQYMTGYRAKHQDKLNAYRRGWYQQNKNESK